MAEQGKNDKRTLYVGMVFLHFSVHPALSYLRWAGGVCEQRCARRLVQSFWRSKRNQSAFGREDTYGCALFPEASISLAGKHRGFCFVAFEFAEDAGEAMDNLHDAEFFGKVLKVHSSERLTDVLVVSIRKLRRLPFSLVDQLRQA